LLRHAYTLNCTLIHTQRIFKSNPFDKKNPENFGS
jgi:hypothetical protein